MIEHVDNSAHTSGLISVTSYAEIAIGAADQYGSHAPGKTTHLYEISLSKIDLIRGLYFEDQGLWKTFIRGGTDGVELTSGSQSRIVPLDRRIEQFAFWEISPDQIREIAAPAEGGFKFYIDVAARKASAEVKRQYNLSLEQGRRQQR